MSDEGLHTIEQDIIQFQKEAGSYNSELLLVFHDLFEGRIYSKDQLNKFTSVMDLAEKYNIKYYILLDEDQRYLSSVPEENFRNVIFLDWFVFVNYIYNVQTPSQDRNKKWNSSATKGLFTPGKIDRFNRCMLISKLWENDDLHKLIWSFFPTEIEKENTKKILKYNDYRFDKFIKECTRVLDLVPQTNTGNFNHVGYPYDANLYKKTLFSVIAESDFGGYDPNHNFIWAPKYTEKTYRAIANKHPIIFSWHKGLVKRFEEKGFKSFKDYLAVPHYNDIENDKERIKATVENIVKFSSTYHPHIENIKNDIEHNYNLLETKFNNELSKLKNMIFDLPQPMQGYIDPYTFLELQWPTNVGTCTYQKAVI